MNHELSEPEAYYRLTALCAASEQCEHNLREKMRKWGLDGSTANKIIDQLYDENYLNEQRFARAYSRDKMRYAHWGKQKISQSLRLLRVSTSAIRQALDELPQEEYEQQLLHVINSKLPTIKAGSDYERYGKLIRFLLGRGFEMPLICKYIKQAEEIDIDDQDEDDSN